MKKTIDINEQNLFNKILKNYNFGDFLNLVETSEWTTFDKLEYISTVSLYNHLTKEDIDGIFVIIYNEKDNQCLTEFYINEEK